MSREDHYFELGAEAGNADLYCQMLIEFVIEAIAVGIRAQVFGSPVRAWDHLRDYDMVVARFAFVVGAKLDIERIGEDLLFLYETIVPMIDTHYPNWSYNCPSTFKVVITPGYYRFVVSI